MRKYRLLMMLCIIVCFNSAAQLKSRIVRKKQKQDMRYQIVGAGLCILAVYTASKTIDTANSLLQDMHPQALLHKKINQWMYGASKDHPSRFGALIGLASVTCVCACVGMRLMAKGFGFLEQEDV